MSDTALNAEFLNLVQDQGMTDIATDVGVVHKSSAPVTKSVTSKKRQASSSSSSKSTSSNPSASKKARKPVRGSTTSTGRSGKASKGLRHFSAKVCEKVKQKGTTTYNQVADELVREFAARVLNNAVDQTYDEKNIRRRVYDALNVLMAMNIITKEKKNISWHGLPANVDHDLDALKNDEENLINIIAQKKEHLGRILQNQIMYKNLVMRNGTAAHKTMIEDTNANKIAVPFIIISTDKETVVQAEMNEDRSDIFFNFTQEFKIHDDEEVCRQLKLHKVSRERALEMISAEFLPYLPTDYFPGETAEEFQTRNNESIEQSKVTGAAAGVVAK